MRTSCASSTSRSTLAVAPTIDAPGPAEKKRIRARPRRMMYPCSFRYFPAVSGDRSSIDCNRSIELIVCGLKVGAALTSVATLPW